MKQLFSLYLFFIATISYSQVPINKGAVKKKVMYTRPQNNTAQLPAPDPKLLASYEWWKNINPTNVNNLSSFTNVNPVNYDTGMVAYSKRTAIALAGWMNKQTDLVNATNGDSLIHLQPLTNLEQLKVNGFISDKGLSHIRQLKNLKEFQVAVTGSMNDYITDQGLVYLGELTHLQKLHLYSCPNVTNKGLRSLISLTNLKEFALLHSSITDEAISLFTSFPMLEVLNLSRTPGITDKSVEMLIEAIRNMKQFRQLIISFTNISAQGRQRLSDAGISFLY